MSPDFFIVCARSRSRGLCVVLGVADTEVQAVRLYAVSKFNASRDAERIIDPIYLEASTLW